MTSRCFDIAIKMDDIFEPTESIVLQLSSDSPGVTIGAGGSTTVFINNVGSK